MGRPSARVEERVNGRCDAIVTALDHQRACMATMHDIRSAEHAIKIAEHELRDAERRLCELMRLDAARVRDLRAANAIDCGEVAA